MTKAMEVMKAGVPAAGLGNQGVFVIGTIFGDVHDIGKNIVKICLEGAGFRSSTWNRCSSGIIRPGLPREQGRPGGISALLSSTMLNIEQAVKAVRKENPQVRVMVGGAPVTEEYAAGSGPTPTPPMRTSPPEGQGTARQKLNAYGRR